MIFYDHTAKHWKRRPSDYASSHRVSQLTSRGQWSDDPAKGWRIRANRLRCDRAFGSRPGLGLDGDHAHIRRWCRSPALDPGHPILTLSFPDCSEVARCPPAEADQRALRPVAYAAAGVGPTRGAATPRTARALSLWRGRVGRRIPRRSSTAPWPAGRMRSDACRSRSAVFRLTVTIDGAAPGRHGWTVGCGIGDVGFGSPTVPACVVPRDPERGRREVPFLNACPSSSARQAQRDLGVGGFTRPGFVRSASVARSAGALASVAIPAGLPLLT